MSETGDRDTSDGAPRHEKSGRRKGGAVTIHEVARHASVSPMTVSRVINGESNVRESTRELVMEAVRALNYRPNPAARVLAGARDTRIALIYSNPSASYLSEMLVGALDGSHRTAAQLVLDRWDNLKPAQEKAAAQKLAEGITGVILPPPLCESKAIAAAFAAEGVPVVALATGKAREDVSCVRIDDFHAAREMTEHLIAHGHTRIAFIKGQEFSSDTAVRWEAVRNSANELGVSIKDNLVGQLEGESSSPELGYQVARQLLASGEKFTALFAFNDISAIGAIQALREAGKRIPEDVSVVGFDDIQSAAFQNPGLTTVKQPLREMGMLAAETLLQRINAPNKTPYPKEIVVEPSLIVRGSTSQART